MRILAISDEEEPGLWERWTPERTEGVDLIVSCGDLSAAYLEFLATATNLPLVYVHGNHDEAYRVRPPLGCVDVDGSAYVCHGLRIVGLGGARAASDGAPGICYTEREMRARIRRITPLVQVMGGLDLLVTHAPALGVGDMDDGYHRGFECFRQFVGKWGPELLVHGHVHRAYGTSFVRRRPLGDATVSVNACGHEVIDVPDPSPQTSGLVTRTVNRLCLRSTEREAEDAGTRW